MNVFVGVEWDAALQVRASCVGKKAMDLRDCEFQVELNG